MGEFKFQTHWSARIHAFRPSPSALTAVIPYLTRFLAALPDFSIYFFPNCLNYSALNQLLPSPKSSPDSVSHSLATLLGWWCWGRAFGEIGAFQWLGCNLAYNIWKGMSRGGSWKRPWSAEEDGALRALYSEWRVNKWSLIAEQLAGRFGLPGRTGKQCRERYNNHLDPALSREDWAPEEEKKLFALHDQLGNRWAVISHRLGAGRTDNTVKNHFFSKLRKSLRRLNRIIQDEYRRQLREIQTKVLYKILEACEERFKPEPMCDPDTSQAASVLKNKILNFSLEGEEPLGEEGERVARELIMEIVAFNRNYKRKPKKFRRTSTQHYDTLEVPRPARVRRAASNDSCTSLSNSHSLQDSRSDFGSEEDESDDDIHYPEPHPHQRKAIEPMIVRVQSQPEVMLEEKLELGAVRAESMEQRREGGCEWKLEQLGLLEELDAAIHPSLMKKQSSMFSGRSSEGHEDEIKFFDDSEIEMRIMFAPLPQASKRDSCDDRLFPE